MLGEAMEVAPYAQVWKPSLRPAGKWIPLGIAFILVVLAGWAVLPALWDFEVYYYAAKAYRVGLDPYETASLSKMAGKGMPLRFVYPPFLLPAFALFTKTTVVTAKAVYMVCKLCTLAGLLAIWGSLSRNAKETMAIAILFVLGFSATVFADVYAGNVTSFEQILFWLGILAFVKRHLWLYAILLSLSATAKLVPIALLLILLVEGRRAIKPILAGLASFAAVQIASYVAFPKLTSSFIAAAGALDEREHSAPSLLALIGDVFQTLGQIWQWAHPRHSSIVLYSFICALLVGLFLWRSWRIGWNVLRTSGSWFFLSGAILTYLLVLPRLKSYGFYISIPIAGWLLLRAQRGLAGLGILAICTSMFSALPKAVLPKLPFWHVVFEYYALICVLALWCCWFIEAQRYLPPHAVAEKMPTPV
jgi:hypothetical protein